MNDVMRKTIDDILAKSAVVLVMKGTPQQPYCGFSSAAVRVLHALGVSFYSVNILEDEDLRAAIKVYADWPTFPMLFCKKELIGGIDIMMDLYQKGDLEKMLVHSDGEAS